MYLSPAVQHDIRYTVPFSASACTKTGIMYSAFGIHSVHTPFKAAIKQFKSRATSPSLHCTDKYDFSEVRPKSSWKWMKKNTNEAVNKWNRKSAYRFAQSAFDRSIGGAWLNRGDGGSGVLRCESRSKWVYVNVFWKMSSVYEGNQNRVENRCSKRKKKRAIVQNSSP